MYKRIKVRAYCNNRHNFINTRKDKSINEDKL